MRLAGSARPAIIHRSACLSFVVMKRCIESAWRLRSSVSISTQRRLPASATSRGAGEVSVVSLCEEAVALSLTGHATPTLCEDGREIKGRGNVVSD